MSRLSPRAVPAKRFGRPRVPRETFGMLRDRGRIGFLGHNDYVEFRKIRIQEQLARKNGLTPKERARLQKELEKASQDIYKQKHDNQDRN